MRIAPDRAPARPADAQDRDEAMTPDEAMTSDQAVTSDQASDQATPTR
jgi:hypothetical protein